MISIAVPGVGKTTALDWAAGQNPQGELKLDSITRSGLQDMSEELSDYRGVLSVGDLGAVDTQYSVKEACKVIALLTYEHRLSKKNVSIDINIADFYGSALSTVQPASVGKLIKGADWDSVLQDKIIRYYHLVRPTNVRNDPIDLDINWGPDFMDVAISDKLERACKRYVDGTIQQWSDSRAVQHWTDLYCAAAAFAGRKAVTPQDVSCTHAIMKPLTLEPYLILRESLSSDRSFLSDDMCILTELASYGVLNHVRTIKNYKVSTRTLQRTIDRSATWIVPGPKGRGEHLPSDQAVQVLEAAGFPVKRRA